MSTQLARHCADLRKKIDEAESEVEKYEKERDAAKEEWRAATEKRREATPPSVGSEVANMAKCVGVDTGLSVLLESAHEATSLGQSRNIAKGVISGPVGTVALLHCGGDALIEADEKRKKYAEAQEEEKRAHEKYMNSVAALKNARNTRDFLRRRWTNECYGVCGALGGLGFSWPDGKCAGKKDYRLNKKKHH